MSRLLVVVMVTVVSLGCETTRAQRPAAQRPPIVERQAPAQQVFKDRRDAFSAAYRHVEKGEFEQARPILETIVSDYPELEDYCLYYLASSHARAGRNRLAVELWRRLLDNHPRSVHSPRAALELGRLLLAQGDPAGAQTALIQARGLGDDVTRRSASLDLARMDIAAGNLAGAYERLMAIRREAPGTAVGAAAKRETDALRQRAPGLAPQGRQLREELNLLLREGDHANAIPLADRLLASASEGERPGILRLRADAELGAGRIEEGLATLRQIHRDHPQSAEAPLALFRRARLLWNRDRTAEAQEAFQYFLRRYPGHAEAAEALYALGRIDEAAGMSEQALVNYRRLVHSYPRASVAGETAWRIGWVHYGHKQWQQAAEAFGSAARGWSSIASDARYWQARALERALRVAEARKIYRRLIAEEPNSYYSHWAAQRLGNPVAGAASVVAQAPSTGIRSAPPVTADAYHLMRFSELHAMGLLVPARKELQAVEQSSAPAGLLLPFLVDAYGTVEGHRDAIRLAQKMPDPEPFVLYPLAFWSRVNAHANENGVDPLLVLSLMRQESMFDAGALSPADARGLMQLLPSTAVEVARRIGRPAPTAEDLYDPETNITLGVAHFRYLLGLYHGNAIKVLAAYNGGEKAVDRWDRQFPGVDLDEWVESITYRETRKYVKRVISNHLRYRALYSASGGRGS